MRTALTILMTVLPLAAIAAGSDSTAPPKPSQTTTQCTKAQIWDEKTRTCVDAKSGNLTDDDRFRAVRELAWADRPEEALVVLEAMAEGDTDRVLTYKGFAHRKAGRIAEGSDNYERALVANPDNILARSYYGQMLVQLSRMDAANAQLTQIRARGGIGSWAEISLANAIVSGKTYSY